MMINRFEDRVNAFYCDSIQNSTTEWGGGVGGGLCD